VLTPKYFAGTVPAAGTFEAVDSQALNELTTIRTTLTENLETFHFREALKDAMNIARLGNKYLQETEPWKVAKTDMERVATILNVALQICANIAVAFAPFLPFMAEKLRKMLAIDTLTWDMLGRADLIAAGTQLGEPQLLFEKIEDDAIEAQLARLARIKEENKLKNWTPEPQQPDVPFDDFMKVDIRVGTVKECTRVPKADKLLQFLIDDGMETRTIVSGIAKYYAPEDLVGKQVCFVANFAPRKLKGVMSQGMILSAQNPDGSLVVIGPTGAVSPGAQVK
jgi:methionyl-tRNA synthetase